MAANDNRRPRRPGETGDRAKIAALVAVVLIGLALYWAVSAIRAHDAVQDCIDSGRHDCVEPDARCGRPATRSRCRHHVGRGCGAGRARGAPRRDRRPAT